MNQKSLDKNKPKELDCWKNELRKIQSPSGIYFIDELGQLEVVAIENFIKQILTRQRTELLEEIKKEKLNHTPNSGAGRVLTQLLIKLKK